MRVFTVSMKSFEDKTIQFNMKKESQVVGSPSTVTVSLAQLSQKTQGNNVLK